MADKDEALEKKTEEIRAELDEMFAAPEAPDLLVPAIVLAGVFFKSYRRYAEGYWELRLEGELSTIVGDHNQAQAQFKQAKKLVEKLVALESQVADQHEEVISTYRAAVKEWKNAARKKQQEQRHERKLEVAGGSG